MTCSQVFVSSGERPRRGLIRAQQMVEYRGLTGYRNVATELMGMSNVARQHWSAISSRTALRMEELDEADELGQQMIYALGAREQGPAQTAESAQIRQRALSLLVNGYDQVRRAVREQP